MKNFFYILSLLFIAAIVYSVITLNFDVGLFSHDNLFHWLVIGAGICGLLLSITFARYQIYQRAKQEKSIK